MSRVALDLVGTTDIAAMLGVSRQRVGQLAATHPDFPPPLDVIGGRRVWNRKHIERWIAAHPARTPGRPPKKAGRPKAR